MNYLSKFTEKEWEDFGYENNFGELVLKESYYENNASNFDDKSRIFLTYLNMRNETSTYLYLSCYGVVDFFINEDSVPIHGIIDDRATASCIPNKMLELNKKILPMIAEKADENYYNEVLKYRLKKQEDTQQRINTLKRKIENYNRIVEFLNVKIAEKTKEQKKIGDLDNLLFPEHHTLKKYMSIIDSYTFSLQNLGRYSDYEKNLIEFIQSQINNQSTKA